MSCITCPRPQSSCKQSRAWSLVIWLQIQHSIHCSRPPYGFRVHAGFSDFPRHTHTPALCLTSNTTHQRKTSLLLNLTGPHRMAVISAWKVSGPHLGAKMILHHVVLWNSFLTSWNPPNSEGKVEIVQIILYLLVSERTSTSDELWDLVALCKREGPERRPFMDYKVFRSKGKKL